MLGNEQDCYGGCTDSTQAFYGLMDEVRALQKLGRIVAVGNPASKESKSNLAFQLRSGKKASGTCEKDVNG